MSGDSPGIFPIGPFPLSRPIDSAYEEQSRKAPRHNLDLSRKKWETPQVWKPLGLASLKIATQAAQRTLRSLLNHGAYQGLAQKIKASFGRGPAASRRGCVDQDREVLSGAAGGRSEIPHFCRKLQSFPLVL